MLFFVIYAKAHPETISIDPFPPFVTIFNVLFNPVPLSTNPNSFLVDKPFIAPIRNSQSYQSQNLHFLMIVGLLSHHQ